MSSNKPWGRLSVKAAASLLLALLVSNVLAGSAAWASPDRQMGNDVDRLKPLSGQDFEIEFMNAMIRHHQAALDMAKLVPDRASHAELKTTAQQIITDQTREITEMTGWLQQWYNATPQSGMNMGMGDMAKLESLTGDAFDQEFMTQMRMHHQSALDMARLVPDRATHAELKTLGENIIRTQTAEIQQFETWLKSWYNVDVAGGGMAGGSTAGETMAPGDTMPRTGAGGGLDLLTWLLPLALLCILVGGVLARREWGRGLR